MPILTYEWLNVLFSGLFYLKLAVEQSKNQIANSCLDLDE